MFEREEVIIVKTHESIVNRGIEKKLRDMDLGVEIIGLDSSGVNNAAKDVKLFVICASQDMYGQQAPRTEIKKIMESITNLGSNAIVVGDESELEEMSKIVFTVRNHTLMKRPIDMDEFEKKVNAILSPEENNVIKKILVVDDDPTFGKTIRDWLKDDFQISVVTAGMQAITFLMKKEVDLILLDYEMPVVDGPQVLEMLRSEPATADIPVIFLTGVSSKEQVQRVVSLKPAGYVLKNIARADLIQYLRNFFDKIQ